MKFALCGLIATLVACSGGHDGSTPTSSMGKPGPVVVLGGRLTDQVTSHPLANVKVFVQGALGSSVLASAVTQADGTYTVAGLPTGVPLHVVSQPVTGAVVYQTRVSGPITLVQGVQPGKVDLAFTQVRLGGAVETRWPGTNQDQGKATYILQHKVGMPNGQVLGAVVRTAPAPSGTLRFEALPPGDYNLLFDRSTHQTLPGGWSSSGTTWTASVQVKAGETTHPNWKAKKPQGAAEEAPR